jgi:ssDNA-binding Zn-finger/Zn-ribbon topoisomerase 1
MENYTPKIYANGRYVEMLVQAAKCPICEKVMVYKEDKNRYYGNRIFPLPISINQESQIKRAGIVFKSTVKVDDAYICEECQSSGKATFLCALCNNRKSIDKVQESIGDPPEFLCADCYASVPSKIWDEKLEELQEEHRYDFE